MASPSSGTQYRLVFNEETTFGTAITANTSWKEFHVPGTVADVDESGLVKDNTKRADGTNIMQNTDLFRGPGGIVTVPLPPTVLTDITIDYLFYLVMQDLVSEGALTPFAKIFEWDDSTVTPDFAGDAGKFVTVVLKSPLATDDRILTSCILSTLTITGDEGANGGRISASGNFLSGFTSAAKYLSQGSQDIGTPTTPGTDYYNICSMVTKTAKGDALILQAINLTFDNKAVRAGCDVNGDAEKYMLGTGEGFSLTGSLSILIDANTKAYIADARTSGFDDQVVLAWGSGNDPADTDGDLLMKLNVGFEAAVRNFPNEIGSTLDLEILGVGDGTNELAEIEIANAVDRTW